jgi:HEAT repeat protein
MTRPIAIFCGNYSDRTVRALEGATIRTADSFQPRSSTRAGSPAIPSRVANGLADPDVQVRRNVALFLNVAAYGSNGPPLNIRGCLPPLVAALKDPDSRVRGLAAQAAGAMGPDASSAVPALIVLLASPDEGSGNSACIALDRMAPVRVRHCRRCAKLFRIRALTSANLLRRLSAQSNHLRPTPNILCWLRRRPSVRRRNCWSPTSRSTKRSWTRCAARSLCTFVAGCRTRTARRRSRCRCCWWSRP